jgi:hypothetical protein
MSDNLPQNERPQRAPSTETRGQGFAWGGLILIGIGVVFMLQTMGLLPRDFNWWALFILMPAVAMYYQAWQIYRQTESFDSRSRGLIIGGTVVLAVAFIFLFDLDWGVMWPVFLILAGILVFVTARR